MFGQWSKQTSSKSTHLVELWSESFFCLWTVARKKWITDIRRDNMKSSKMKASNKNCSKGSRQMIETACFGHFSSNCRRNATSGLVIYFLLLQSIPVRANEIGKASAYRYQGPGEEQFYVKASTFCFIPYF
jgi:hypothetical protein